MRSIIMSVTRSINKQNAKHSTGPNQEALVQASISRALANLSLHRERLSRQYERTLKQLRELQKARFAKEQSDRNA